MKILKKIFLSAAVIGAMASGTAQAADKIVLDGSTTVGPIAKAFAEHFTKATGVEVTVSESGSGNGAKSLINKTCDIADMSRPMKESEIAAAKTNGINPVAHIVALDGLSIVVHPSNRVKGLSKAQIRDIYSGKFTNWKEVGGPNAGIIVIQRESNSGTQDSFKELVMGETTIFNKAETQSSNGAKDRREGNLARVGDPAQRVLTADFPAAGARQKSRGHLRLHPSGGDTVDQHPLRRQGLRHRLAEGVEACLARTVGWGLRLAPEGAARGDVHDPAAALLGHRACRQVGEVCGADQVRGKERAPGALPFLEARCERGVGAMHRGIVDDDRDRAQPPVDRVPKAFHLRGVGHVGLECRVPLARQSVDDRLRGREVPVVVHGDPDAPRRQVQRDLAADAAGGACHQGAEGGFLFGHGEMSWDVRIPSRRGADLRLLAPMKGCLSAVFLRPSNPPVNRLEERAPVPFREGRLSPATT